MGFKLFNSGFQQDENDVDHRLYREKIFFYIFLVSIMGAFLPYYMNMKLSLNEGGYLNAAIYTSAYLVALLVTFVTKIPFTLRAWTGLFLFYLMGVIGLVTYGPETSGRMWLFMFVTLTTLVLGLRAGLTALGINIVTILLWVWGWSENHFSWIASSNASSEVIWTTVFSFIFMTLLVSSSLGLFLNYLEKALDRSQELSTQLRHINEKLEEEHTQLHKERERQANIIEGANVGTWEWNVQTGETIFNEKWAEIIGYSLEELIPISIETWSEKTHPDDLKTSDKRLQAHFNGETDHYECEFRMRHKDGHWVWILDRGKVISWTAEDKPLWLFGTHIDITSRKLTEEKLRQSERLYRLLADNSGDVIWIRDMELNLTYVSPAVERVRGFTPEEALNQKMDEVLTEESTKLAVEAFTRLIPLALEDDGGKSYPIDLEHRCKDGSTKWLECNLSLLRDNDGQAIGVLGVSRDISGRKQAESRLRASEEQFRHFFEHLTVGVVVYEAVDGGEDFVFYEMNPVGQELSQVSIDEIRGERLTKIFPGVQELGLFKALQDTWRTGQPSHIPFSKYKDDRITEWVENRVFQLPSGRVVAVYDDRTELIRLEEELRQAQKMEAIGTLAGGIAHDFNNILAAIIGFTELSLEDTPAGMPIRSNLEQIYKSALRARDLVRQILSFSRQTEHEKRPFNVEPIVKETLKLLRATIPTTIDIRQDIAPDIGPVEGDPTQIHQLILNLGTNAADAMKAGGGILTVRLEDAQVDYKAASGHSDLKAGRYLKITVQDTGPGIPTEIRDRIFEPFFTTKEVGAGTGMGLSVVHGIVHSLNGVISVGSDPDQGALFTIYLPVAEAEAASIDAKAGSDLLEGSGRVLFVDDEEAVARLGELMLARLGYNTVVTSSSLEALETFKADPEGFDLIITDMAMPSMNGVTLAREIHSINQDTPIILCTGYSDQIDEAKAKDIGVNRLLLKPLSLHEVSQVLHELMDNGRPD